MEAFEYARPKSTQEAIKLLAGAEGEALALAGGTDLISLMKDGVSSPKRLVACNTSRNSREFPSRQESGLRLGAWRDLGRVDGERRSPAALPRLGSGGGGRHAARKSAAREPWAATSASARAAGTIAPGLDCWRFIRANRWSRTATTATTPSWEIPGRLISSARRAWRPS